MYMTQDQYSATIRKLIEKLKKLENERKAIDSKIEEVTEDIDKVCKTTLIY